ncbi:MAG: HEAT repeat domain-containing protein, partial [Deltaproteobacteria bacterium]|nr:HEAT repeat domain-containing protein [Deltaproteobacteria bacterium]
RDVRERLELLLADRDFRVQAAAVEALAVVGDPAAIEPLRRMVERELDGRLRRRGKEVMRDLGEGAPLQDEVRRLRDELGELRSLTGALRERLDHLEAKDGPPADGKRGKQAGAKATKATKKKAGKKKAGKKQRRG